MRKDGPLEAGQVAAGEVVIQEGDAGDAFYLVGEGDVAAYKQNCAEAVATYGPGDSFGELALMYDCPRQATVKCITEAKLYKLGRIHFRNLVSSYMTKSKAGLEKQLSNIALLRGLQEEELKQLADAMESVEFAAGDYIAERGSPADSLFVILSGEVACHKDGETELRLAEGAVFGESCFSQTSEPKREANVVAVDKVRCARLMVSDCNEILGSIQRAIDRSFCKKVINSIDIFSSLSVEERTELFTKLTVRRFAGGDTIIKQGVVGNTFYIVKRGSVDVLTAVGGASTKVKTLSSGQYFGERSLLTEEAAVASVVATDEVELMCLPKETFEALLGPMQKLIDREISRRDREREQMSQPKIAWSDLDLRQVLGEGSFGSVRLALHKPSHTAYALKQLHKGHLISTNQVHNTVNEKRIMKMCTHP